MADEIMKYDIDEEEFEQDQYLVFTAKSQEFGFRALQVQEISSALSATEVPNAPSYVEGVLNLRGRLVSVINFRQKFGLEPKERDEDTRIIIVEYGGFPIGVLVDSVEEVIKIPEGKVQELPASASTSVSDEEHITGVGILGNRLIILLDVDKVLSKTELTGMDTIERVIDEGRAEKTAGEAEGEETDVVLPTKQPTSTVKSRGKRKEG